MNRSFKMYHKYVPVATNFLIIALFAITSACNHVQKRVDKHVGFSETDKIIEAVILQDSLPVIKQKKHQSQAFIISSSLYRTYVINKRDRTNRQQNVVLLSHLLQDRYFQRSDSLFLFSQNDRPATDSISRIFQKRLNLPKSTPATGPEDDIVKEYVFCIPIFSKDGKTAFVTVTNYCSHCMSTDSYFLEKSHDEWKLVTKTHFMESEGA